MPADCSCLDVPLKEASRFGIMNTDANNRRIGEFEEKPAEDQNQLRHQ